MSDLNEVARLLRELIQAARENTEEVRRLRGAQSAECEIGYARVANPNAPDGYSLVPRPAGLSLAADGVSPPDGALAQRPHGQQLSPTPRA